MIHGSSKNQRFILFRRGDVFYCEDRTTRKQTSLRTRDENEAVTLLHARNKSVRQPVLNLQIARAYLSAGDPALNAVHGSMSWSKSFRPRPAARERWDYAIKDQAF